MGYNILINYKGNEAEATNTQNLCIEKNVEAERGKMRAKANRKTGRGEL